MEEVALTLDDDLTAWLGMAEQGAEIAHRSTGNEERGLLADHLGRALLQPMDGGVFIPNVVADLGGRHRPTHRFGRERKGIASQLDDPLHQQSLSNVHSPSPACGGGSGWGLSTELGINQWPGDDDLADDQVALALDVDLDAGLEAAGGEIGSRAQLLWVTDHPQDEGCPDRVPGDHQDVAAAHDGRAADDAVAVERNRLRAGVAEVVER